MYGAAVVARRKKPKNDRILLATVTGEPFQLARLYWSIPTSAAVTRVFTKLRCMDEDEEARCWAWLYEGEVAALTFGKPRSAVPPGVHPILIGRFRLPQQDRLVLEVRSFERAIEAAKFFAPLFGPTVVLERARVINRWFDAQEAREGLDGLDRLLDQSVAVIDPKKSEEAFRRAMEGARTQEEKIRAFERYSQECRQQDVPLVEDFPLASEEETPEFRHLTMTLRLRALRAFEHWNGHTQLTLADVIHRLVEQGNAGGAFEGLATGVR